MFTARIYLWKFTKTPVIDADFNAFLNAQLNYFNFSSEKNKNVKKEGFLSQKVDIFGCRESPFYVLITFSFVKTIQTPLCTELNNL